MRLATAATNKKASSASLCLPFTTPPHVQSSIPKLANTARTTPSSCSTPSNAAAFSTRNYRNYKQLALSTQSPSLPTPSTTPKCQRPPRPWSSTAGCCAASGNSTTRGRSGTSMHGIFVGGSERGRAGWHALCVGAEGAESGACMYCALASTIAAPSPFSAERVCMRTCRWNRDGGGWVTSAMLQGDDGDRRGNGHDVAA